MIKHNEKHLLRINDNIARVKEYLEKLGELQSDNKEVFWKALKKIIEKSKIGHAEKIRSLLGIKSLDHPGTVLADIKFMAGAMQAYDEVLDLVDKNQDACDEASANIKELQKIAEDVKANIDLQ